MALIVVLIELETATKSCKSGHFLRVHLDDDDAEDDHYDDHDHRDDQRVK